MSSIPHPAGELAVRPRALRDAGAHLRRAADQVAELDPAPTLRNIDDAMPASESEVAARELRRVWRDSFGAWVVAASRHADALADGADDYDAADHRVATLLTVDEPPQHLPEPGRRW